VEIVTLRTLKENENTHRPLLFTKRTSKRFNEKPSDPPPPTPKFCSMVWPSAGTIGRKS
jgi:hypothetical protein